MIEVLDSKSLYAKNVFRVRMSKEFREAHTTQQIINIVDNHCRVELKDQCNNFGGSVERLENGLYNVTVYTD